jgi:D-alanyl-D-alanine carboxypeptidase
MNKLLNTLSVLILAVLLFMFLFSCNNGICPVPASDYNCTTDIDSIINPNHPKTARYQAFLDSLTRAGMVGISVLVCTPKDGIWAGSSGMADIAAGAPMRTCNLFRIGSITKLYTADAIFKLSKKGLLNINNKAADYLPKNVVDKIANCDKATIRQLLSHMGGIPELHTTRYYLDQYNNPSKKWTQMDLLDEAVGEPAVCAPGERYFYSDVNYILLGMVIEQVTSKGYDQFISNEIVAPLGLNHTIFDKTCPTPVGTVRGYQDIRGNGKIEDCSNLWDNVVPGAEGGVVTDIFDLYLFFKTLLKERFLTDSSLTEMDTCLEKGCSAYGTFVGHGGSERGYRSWVLYFKDTDIFVIWFTNGPNSSLPSDMVNSTLNLWFLSPTTKTSFYNLVFE